MPSFALPCTPPAREADGVGVLGVGTPRPGRAFIGRVPDSQGTRDPLPFPCCSAKTMKFAKSIESQQEGQTKFRYMGYKSLKRSIKSVVCKVQCNSLGDALTANMAFEEALASEIHEVDDCFAMVHGQLMNSIASLAEEASFFQQAAEGAEPDEEADCALADQIGNIIQQLVDVIYEVDQLRKYAIWNAIGVVKILKKRRKLTKFGLEDMSGERAGWLLRHKFFGGTEFAELHAAVESLGETLVRVQLAALSSSELSKTKDKGAQAEAQTCPICLDSIRDMVELECGHGFCWKCFVLGPIAFLPGEYCISQCPICRQDTEAGELAGRRLTRESSLSHFFHAYFAKDSHSKGSQEADQASGPEPVAGEFVREFSEALLGDLRDGLPNNILQSMPRAHGALGAAQKAQWLQRVSTGDPLALSSSAFCAICSEPLPSLEGTVTTPCKHHFHQSCMQKLELPVCPCCGSSLPVALFLPEGHPCGESGFHTIPPEEYRPSFPGGPSRGSGGYPLHRPPPESLLGPGGLRMRSYLHRAVPPSMSPPSLPSAAPRADSPGKTPATPSASCLPTIS